MKPPHSVSAFQIQSLLTVGLAFGWCVNAAPRIDVTTHDRPHTTFQLDQPTWVEVKLPSLETDVFLMFNSSMDESVPVFDVYGTVCKQERNVLLFSRIKGPVSKMISRSDLHSLKSRTKCNTTTTTNETIIHLLIQPSKPVTAEATINALILKNNTSTSPKPQSRFTEATTVSSNANHSQDALTPFISPKEGSKTVGTGTEEKTKSRESSEAPKVTQDSTNGAKETVKPVSLATVIPVATVTTQQVKRRRREAPQGPPVAQTVANSLELDVILNDDDDYFNLKIFDGTELGTKCRGILKITSPDCISEPKKLESSNSFVRIDDTLKCQKKPQKLHVKVESLECVSDSKKYRLDVTPGNSTTGNLLYLWIPLALLLTSVTIVIILFIVYQKIRSKQRHEFQRQSVLSRTLSDPRPNRIVAQAWKP